MLRAMLHRDIVWPDGSNPFQEADRRQRCAIGRAANAQLDMDCGHYLPPLGWVPAAAIPRINEPFRFL
jgi:hypothetical protein